MRRFIAILFLIAAARVAHGDPNVLLIVVDDMGVDAVNSYRTLLAPPLPDPEVPQTPTIDQLASEGLLFRNAWADPFCAPTRITIQTGLYAYTRLGASNAPTIAELLPASYKKAAFGKWGGVGGSPVQNGYDNYYITKNGNFDIANGEDYFHWTKEVWDSAVCGGPLRNPCDIAYSSDGPNGIGDDSYATSVNVDDVATWITAHQNDSWFILLSFNAAHTPLQIPPTDLLSSDTVANLPQNCNQGTNDDLCFQAMVEAMDKELYRLIYETPALDTNATTIIFVGDNGTDDNVSAPSYLTGGGKGSLYEGGINVPLIIRPAGSVAGVATQTALVNTTDLFATVLDLAGVTPPAGTDSFSLVPILDSPGRRLREYVFAEGGTGTTKAIRNRQYKFIDQGTGQLYEMSNPDILDNNLLDGPLSPEAACNLERLQVGLQRINEALTFPPPIPDCMAIGPDDADNDGVTDGCDYCPTVCNPDQVDMNDDGICDCDGNDLDDWVEIYNGRLTDDDNDGNPDECQCPFPTPCACPGLSGCNYPGCTLDGCSSLDTTDNQCVLGTSVFECDPGQTVYKVTCNCAGGPSCLPGANCGITEGCGESKTLACQ